MEWVVKDKSSCKSQYDAELMLSKTVTKGRNIICFRFRKNSYYKIIADSEPFAVIAKVGSKIYFKKADSKTGFKLRDIGFGQKYLRVPESKKFSVSDSECGEFNLKYDRNENLVYIDTEFKLSQDMSWQGRD